MTSKAKQTVVVNTKEEVTIDNFSLQSIGAYMLFKHIDEESAEDLCEFIIKANYMFPPEQAITLLINSPGGGVYDAFGIIDLMESSKLEIQTVGIGLIASMAALIFTCGTKGRRMMSKNSFIMTHQFSQTLDGKYHEFIAQREHEDDIHKRFIQHFVRHTKMNEKQITDVLLSPADRYITAKEALKLGICDIVKDPWS